MEFFIAQTILAIVSLVVFLYYDFQAKEARAKYNKAADAAIAFGEAIQKTFEQVEDFMNNQLSRSNSLARGFTEHELDLNLIKSIVTIHSQALNLTNLIKTFDNLEDIKKRDELSEEINKGTVQG